MFALSFHIFDVGQRDPMGRIHAFYNDAFCYTVQFGNQLIQAGKQVDGIHGFQQIVAGFYGVAVHSELHRGGNKHDFYGSVLFS